MIGASPHQYRAGGKAVQRTDAVIEAAIRQTAAIERNGIPAILTIRHLAFRTGETYRYLRSIAAARDGKHYREFLISKRSGGKRRIVVPEPRLMAIQRWIARHILRERPVDAASFAYAPSSSILRCAAQHSCAGWLVKLDIHDFFESITETQVYRVFQSLGYQPLVAFELARLCTKPWVDPPLETLPKRRVRRYRFRGLDIYRRLYTGYLPQGAPTSPMLSNLVCRKLDSALTAFAVGRGIVYTRYSDDLTFSGAKGTFDRDTALAIVNDARIILARHGFRLHEGKITIVPPGGRKQVLGLLVDRATPRLTKELRSRLTDHIRGVEKFGVASHAQVRGFASPTGMAAHIGGLIRFARHIDPTFGSSLLARYNAALRAHSWSPPA